MTEGVLDTDLGWDVVGVGVVLGVYWICCRGGSWAMARGRGFQEQCRRRYPESPLRSEAPKTKTKNLIRTCVIFFRHGKKDGLGSLSL